ncbi:hypothetical protein WJX81_008291 [Elliptochloris bilobata]|uniref:PSP proline-rich domain-containing protein n=1 Tax=Elliptochloris bilobata TaxID=381761 RepID=A0AAW1QIR7_9CHLO
MARDESAAALADANGTLEGDLGQEPHANGPVANGGDKKLTAAEREKEKRRRAALRKKQKKASKQAERAALEARQRMGEEEESRPSKLEVEIEYVSAPREYEELLAPSNGDAAAAMDLDGGLGLGSDWGGETPGGAGLGLGATLMDVAPAPATPASNPYEDFQRVFSKFASAEEVTGAAPAEEEEAPDEDEEKPVKEEAAAAAREADSDDDADAEERASKKKRKLEARMKIAELKQSCPRPEVVEVWDVTAQDPRLLVYLKAYRNSVPVPRHWSQKRKYLQGKRGLEKPPFKLPDFIEATGIGEMRQAYQEKEENKKLRQKQKDKVQPKMGKLDIDYQVLHDAFFKHQTKPTLTPMGALYYEGKEFEARMHGAKPGVLPEELRKALGMGENTPPPWLINMQRYGPPPSYPDLKVPGLSAAIPPGAQFGFQPGGWGKPPVDENGNPLYGDVFGQAMDDGDDDVDKAARWGDLESDEEAESEEEEEEEEELGDEGALADGLASVASGYSSLPSGIETPEVLDLRKAKAIGGGVSEARPLYTVLEQQAAAVGTNLMGSDHTYVIPPAAAGATPTAPRVAPGQKRVDALQPGGAVGDVEVALDPAELEGLDEAGVRALYEQRLEEQRAAHSREDFSDLVAAKAAQQKRKAAERKEATKGKKSKETFKF